MKKHFGNIVKFIISLGIGVGLVFWSLRNITTEHKQLIIDSFKRANYSWLLLLILFGLLSNFFRTERWRILLKPLGYTPNYWNTFSAVMIMFFANLLFPRLGEVMRCTILYKYENVPVEKSIGTMVLERVVDLVSILIIGGIILLVEYDKFYQFFVDLFLKKPEVTDAVSASFWSVKNIVLIIISSAVLAGIAYIIKKHGFEKLKQIVKEKLFGVWQGLISIKDIERRWEFIFHTVAIWVCYILMPYFGFKCLTETAHLGVSAAMASVFFGGFAMVATQGGIGAFQIVSQKVLETYGIAAIIGFSYGWISWTMQTVFVLAGGILSLIFLAISNKDGNLSK